MLLSSKNTNTVVNYDISVGKVKDTDSGAVIFFSRLLGKKVCHTIVVVFPTLHTTENDTRSIRVSRSRNGCHANLFGSTTIEEEETLP